MTRLTLPGNHDASTRLRVRLYVAGDAPNSVAAVANLRAALAQHPGNEADVEVIDVLKDPERGLHDGILVTPMLVKVQPPPERRILGNLRDRGILLGVLGLDEAPHD